MRAFLIIGLTLFGLTGIAVHAQTGSGQIERQTTGTILDRLMTSGEMTYQVKLQDGQTVTVGDNESVSTAAGRSFFPGDRVVVTVYRDIDGLTRYLLADHARGDALLWVVGLFLVAIWWFTRSRGLRSLVSLGVSLVMLILWVVPSIANGSNPVVITLIGASLILAITLLWTEGLTRMTAAALGGTVGAMMVTGFLSAWAISFTKLSGLGSEEAFALGSIGLSRSIDLSGLLLAGILVGILGVLDDVAVAQAATVAELRHANPTLTNRALYQAAMRVGRSHLVAIINTLALAYAGTALPLLVLFRLSDQPFGMIVSSELVATEIVRTVLGSIGLLLAVPLTTILAVILQVRPHSSASHSHA